MRRSPVLGGRRVAAVVLLVALALVPLWVATARGETDGGSPEATSAGDSEPEGHGTEGEVGDATPAPTASPDDDPVEDPGATPTSSPAPEPSASAPTPTGSPVEDEDADAEAQAVPEEPGGGLSVAVSAAPGSISEGDATTITTVVTNSGEATASAVEATVTLPRSLGYSSARPRPQFVADSVPRGPGGEIVLFAVGDLAPGAEAVLTVVGEGVRPTASGPEVVRVSAQSGEEAVFAETPVVVEPAPGGSLTVRARSSGLLVEVGGTVRYTVTISNPGPGGLEDVVVQDRVPSELDIASVPLPPLDEVDAVQYGSHLDQEDIVWVVGDMAPHETIAVTWTGKVVSAGDFAASNLIRGRAEGSGWVEDDDRTYLASEATVAPQNPTFEPVERRVVTTERVEVPVERGATSADAQPGSALPFTGARPLPLGALAVALIALGLVLVNLSRHFGATRVRSSAVIVVAVLLLSACVSSEPEGDRGDVDDRVKGVRITQGENGPGEQPGEDEERDGPGGEPGAQGDAGPGSRPGEDDADDPAPPFADPGDDDAAAAPGDDGGAPPIVAEPDDEPQTRIETVTRVEVVAIGLEDLPVRAVGTLSDEHSLGFSWDDAATDLALRDVGSVSAGPARLSTTAVQGRHSISVTVELRNSSSSSRLAVDGYLVHEVWGPRGLVGRFSSERIDATLSPGGDTAASFSYRLPSDGYRTTTAFRSA